MNEVNHLLKQSKNLNFDTIAVSFIDFKKNTFEVLTNTDSNLYFDLASLTKPLTLASVYLKDKSLFTKAPPFASYANCWKSPWIVFATAKYWLFNKPAI